MNTLIAIDLYQAAVTRVVLANHNVRISLEHFEDPEKQGILRQELNRLENAYCELLKFTESK
jgi:hypothetical protein